MEFRQIYPFIIPFVIGQFLGIAGGLWIDSKSWENRTNIEGASFVWNYVFLSSELLISVFIGAAKLSHLSKPELIFGLWVLGAVFLHYASLLIPAWYQRKQFKISLHAAYFGTMHQFHIMLLTGFGSLVLYGFVLGTLFSSGVLTQPEPLIGLPAFTVHFVAVFWLMALARPFWTRELSRLRLFVKRH